MIATGGKSIAVVSLKDTTAYQVLSSTIGGFPVQMFWAILFVVVSIFLYDRHKFGAWLYCVGDNPDSAAQMGIDSGRIRVYALAFMGFAAGLAGIYSTVIHFAWSTAGDSYLLPTLAAVFVGGTPT